MLYIFVWILLTVGYLVLKEKYYSYFFFMVIAIVSGFRYFVGRDFAGYYEAVTSNYDIGYEMGNIYLIDFIRYIGFPQLFFIITSMFTIFSFTCVIKKYSLSPFTSTLVFLAIPVFWVFSLCIVRQYIAMSIIFIATPFIFKRKFLHYCIMVFIAQLFHSSASLAILLYPLVFINIKRGWALVFLLSSFFIGVNLIEFVRDLFPKYARYTTGVAGEGGGQINFLLFFVFAILAVFFKDKFIKEEKSNFFFNAFLLGVCIYSTFIDYEFIGPRGSLYYTMYLPILFPLYLCGKDSKIVVTRQFVAYFALFTLYIISVFISYWKTGESSILPYNFFFE